jgi:hypothetical protein
MNISFMVRQMADNTDRINALVRGVSEEESRWKVDAASWSILETVNHLYDEEIEDFRVKLDIILHRPEEPWPPIDPEGWVIERKYNERDLEESLENFLDERKSSLKWLRSLEKPDWDATYTSPFGSMSAGDMFSSWVTHDHLHMRQLVELHRFLTEFYTDPYKMDYAGQW